MDNTPNQDNFSMAHFKTPGGFIIMFTIIIITIVISSSSSSSSTSSSSSSSLYKYKVENSSMY